VLSIVCATVGKGYPDFSVTKMSFLKRAYAASRSEEFDF